MFSRGVLLHTALITKRTISRGFDPAIDAFTKMSVGDGSSSRAVHGNRGGLRKKTEAWLADFKTYTAFRDLQGDAKIQLFRKLLTDQAADWLRCQERATTNSFDHLMCEFRRRLPLTDIDRWRKASSLWQRNYSSPWSLSIPSSRVSETPLGWYSSTNLNQFS